MNIADIDPTKVTATILLLCAVTAFVKEWVVPGVTYNKALTERDSQIVKLTQERDEFKQMLMSAVDIVDRTQRVRGGGLLPTVEDKDKVKS